MELRREYDELLAERADLEDLLESLMDAVIAVTNADKGFLVLFESGEPRVRVARNLRSENIDDAVDQLSDSIIAKVVKTKKPLIVSNRKAGVSSRSGRSTSSAIPPGPSWPSTMRWTPAREPSR